jgi:hypothetical protein
MMVAPLIPGEIIERVSDCVELDPNRAHAVAALRALTLVHPSWTHAAQSRLFRRLYIRQREDWPRLYAALDAWPHLRLFIRTLHVHASRPKEDIVLQPLREYFPAIRTLSLHNLPIDVALIAGLSLCELRLDKCIKSFVPDFAHTPELSAADSAPRLEILHVRDGCESVVNTVRWLETLHALEDLRAAELYLNLQANYEACPALAALASQWDGLQELTLFLLNIHLEAEEPNVGARTFSKCSASHLTDSALGLRLATLVTLRLDSFAIIQGSTIVFSILQQSTLPALRHLHLTFYTCRPFSAMVNSRTFANEPLPVALAGQLESARVRFVGVKHFLDMDGFRRLFGPADQPGILEIVLEPDEDLTFGGAMSDSQ